MVSLFLKSDITIANPITASDAATVITKNTNIWPLIFPKNEEKETRDKLIAFNISSIHIKIIIAFRLINTPVTPIENKIPLINKKYTKSIINKIKKLIFKGNDN
jgi:hypothetical protein